MLRIITDSAADFEPYELEKLNVTCVPMSIIFGEKEYSENINLSKNDFYELLLSADEMPHTSQPSPDSFIRAMEEIQKSGDDCLIITLSSALSGTWQGACLAKDMLEYQNCYVFDSLEATAGQRILVETAVRMRDDGKNVQEIISELETLRSRIVVYACIDTLEYLHKGGRISGLSYTLGSAINIKPVICVNNEGKIEIPAKAIGRVKGFRYMIDELEKTEIDERYSIYLVYTHNKENAVKFSEMLAKRNYKISENHIFNVGAAIGAHIGPDAVGIVYVKKEV